jgi:hypothetical protein
LFFRTTRHEFCQPIYQSFTLDILSTSQWQLLLSIHQAQLAAPCLSASLLPAIAAVLDSCGERKEGRSTIYTLPCCTNLEESEFHNTLFSHHLMPLDEAPCSIAAPHELSLGVLLDAWLFLLESTLNAFSAFLLTDSSGSLATSFWCAVSFELDLLGETCTIQQSPLN